MTTVVSYRDLLVWQKSIELARRAYKIARKLPSEERFEMASQLRRAAVSIPSNIAEGHARNHRKEFIQFIGIAKGSLAELQTLLVLAVKMEFVQRLEVNGIFQDSEERV